MSKTATAKEQEMIRIDGSIGEGGGQILRTSLGLSLATGKPFCIENIRANRHKPGLLRQHLTAVQAAAEVGSAHVEGGTLGSMSLTFIPGKVKGGEYHFASGTAGSTTLVFQTVLPALMTADEPSTIVIEGGTHNMMAPPFDFLEKTFVPLINRMGPKIELQLHRFGFYPAGGGKFSASITPAKKMTPLEIGERSGLVVKRAIARVSNLPRHIANRELEQIEQMLGWNREWLGIEDTKNSTSPGNVVMIEISDGNVTEICTSFGRLGVSAERVAAEAVEQAKAYLDSRASVGEHLADQLMVPFALSGGGSFASQKLSEHSLTNMNVIRRFLDVEFTAAEHDGYVKVEISLNS